MTATLPTRSRLKSVSLRMIFALLAVLFLAPIAGNICDHFSRPPVAIPDEQTAGQELLARKFTGPGYFQPDAAGRDSAANQDRYDIGVAAARAQVARVAEERKLSTMDVARLNAVIERIAEAPPSRVIGQKAVNTLRLNLALDEIR